MEFRELLKQRRAVRDFEDKTVATDILKEMVEDAILAPNASHKQPWKFVIVNNKDMMKRISDDSKNTIIAGIEKNPDSPMKGYLAVLKDENFNVFYNSPALICVVSKIKGPLNAVDCALAASYLMFSATSRGLGTCWVAQGAEVRDENLLKELGIPEGYRIYAPIIVGYPKTIPPAPERKPVDILQVIS
ncbi:MAG: nitroreductase [Deltaproteobacteria bacterium]|jgi:nitroreductase|nr:nitroreductase [Deltaproteobacteria bacterium]MBT4263834.1 nitroreductase [Deltaproteobacteria bacterium]MBT4641416.1 nitroreductase [Deltaproteobacteria bacterium]MBT6502397.1 nitroreductase [Deltaproteobacteria bacterium]MBT6613751.1 nitroreductase [Deltaproteobacteria bacterium]